MKRFSPSLPRPRAFGLLPSVAAGPALRRLAAGVAALIAAAPLLAAPESKLPPLAAPSPLAPVTLVWVGIGQASVWVDGAWQRAPAHDYEFSVVQRRLDAQWLSIKSQHRRHPDYDGSAGPRDQAHHFRIDFAKAVAATAPRAFVVESSFGAGSGTIDAPARDAAMEFAARGVSRFAPFNTYRITQHYGYEAGELTETVELLERKGGADAPFMKIEERATLFAPQRFDGAPSAP